MDLQKVLLRPLVTEKSMNLTAQNKYSFAVSLLATKKEIARAVSLSFQVTPVAIRVIRLKGKSRRSARRRQTIWLSDWKKAIVTLKEGQTIDLFEVAQKN